MENLLESNERALVMFDSVCSGLAGCLALVHADIRQMSEHRNWLAQLEQDQIRAKLVPADQLEPAAKLSGTTEADGQPVEGATEAADDDPHHLSKLKLLDKWLADSFSHALSMNDLQKSSLNARRKQQQQQQLLGNGADRPSFFQALLGWSGSKSVERRRSQLAAAKRADAKLDNKTIIDDINRQTRLAMQYSKQLESHLLKVEELRSRYELHLKMGLVVKSVAKAYLSTSACSPNGSGRRSASTAFVINDRHSSIGTHSSVSSLNLSTWSSSSRSKARKQQQRHQDSANNNTHHQNGNGRCVSTLSLNSKHHKRLSLAKLISSVRSGNTDHQAPPEHAEPEHIDGLDEMYPSNGGLAQRLSSRQSSGSTSYSPSPPQQFVYGDWVPVQPRQSLESTKSARQSPPGYETYNCDDGAGKPSANLQSGFLYHYRDGGSTATSDSCYTCSRTELPPPRDSALMYSMNLAPCPPDGVRPVNASHSLLRRNRSKNSHEQQASKTTIKEFIENIDKIEAEFESYMGSFLLAIEDIQGFARVCQGDVFEITIKYGDAQKFKTRISVLKDNKQKCDNRQTVFKAKIADVLAIKAYECKGLGKRTLLGHKLCETRDLFTARSQLMTISLNQTGSIKLNMIVTWNPLHLTPNSISPNQLGVS